MYIKISVLKKPKICCNRQNSCTFFCYRIVRLDLFPLLNKTYFANLVFKLPIEFLTIFSCFPIQNFSC